MPDPSFPHGTLLSPIGTEALPQERVTVSDWRSVARVVGLAALFFALANIALAFAHGLVPINGGFWMSRAKWELLDRARGADIVYVGDSSCAVGLDPGAIEQAIGLGGLNLCTVGNMGLLDDVLMIDALTRESGGPSLFVIVHSLDVWARPVDDRAVGRLPWRIIPGTPRTAGLPQTVGGWGQAILTRIVPFYTHRDALRAFVRRPRQVLSGLPQILTHDGRVVVTSANPAAVTRDLEEWRGALSGQPFALPRANRRAFSELERIVDERNLRVVIANGPLAEPVASDPDLAAYRLARDQWFRERFERGAIQYLGWQGVYDEGQMESADHLVADAPQSYSRALAAELERLLAR